MFHVFFMKKNYKYFKKVNKTAFIGKTTEDWAEKSNEEQTCEYNHLTFVVLWMHLHLHFSLKNIKGLNEHACFGLGTKPQKI